MSSLPAAVREASITGNIARGKAVAVLGANEPVLSLMRMVEPYTSGDGRGVLALRKKKSVGGRGRLGR